MAAPQNTYASYDMVGIREDLSDMIYNIDPEDTPLYSSAPKTKATNTYHEWQTDNLRDSAENAHIEGDDTIATVSEPTTRLGNYTQIFKESAAVSGTDTGLNKAGRAREMRFQVVKKSKVLKLDIEKALFANQARDAGSGSTPRKLAGLPAWITTNVDAGSGGSDPTGDGTDARTDGTQAALTQARFDSVMRQMWDNGAKPQMVYLSSFQMEKALDFVGNNNQRNTQSSGRVSNDIVLYQTPYGQVRWTMSREHRSRDVFIVQPNMISIANLRPMRNSELARTGDSEKRQIITELTLRVNNEKAHGIIADCTTS